LNTYDYIIIGAGAAGCVIANRLSANPKNSVCVIEAGGSDKSPWIKIPAGIFGVYGNKKFDYAYEGSPQKNLESRSITVNRGKCLGGSSSINGMVYIRGNKNDYDNWAALGCKGWSYEDVLPVFKKLENNNAGGDSKYHGFDGELSVVAPQDANASGKRFISAGAEIGLSQNPDFNSESQIGLGIYNVTQSNGTRVSSYTAFLEPILSRDNLTILTNTTVSTLDILGEKVTSINIKTNGVDKKISFNKEVVVCSGAIDSPRLLLASGIGDKDELQNLGITCNNNLPGVGKNLQDHLDCMVTVRSDKAESIGVSWKSLIPNVLTAPFNYYFNKMGWWTTNYVEAGGFAKTKESDGKNPDIQFHFTPIFRSHRGKNFEFGHGYSIFTCLLKPFSSGSVKLAKEGEIYKTLIDHNFLSDKRDEATMIEALKNARNLLSSKVFDDIRGKEMAPGESIQSDEEILNYIRKTALTVYHPVGTCKMGVDEMSVVEPYNLKVKGMSNLRVIDASIMPTIVSGNTSAPTMMIAEMGAQMILDKV
jgi:choline dehydrogenase-like flavoprotein|tara:strand:- start:169 stop:1773 length:1605 start_codon:yes stop_codon:yes gene_type:complete